MLTVVEPGHNGIGGDAFALVWNTGKLYGLNGSGRSPAQIDGPRVDRHGPRSVTVPGAVSRVGRPRRALRDARARRGARARGGRGSERGVAATARVANHWQRSPRAPWPAPQAGDVYALPDLARTLRRLADEGPAALYHGDIAEQIAAASWLSADDLAAHRTDWVEPLRADFRGLTVCECPPNTQGVAVIEALAAMDEHTDLHGRRIEAVRHGLDYARTTRRRRAPRRHDLSLRRRRGPHGRLAHPEHLRALRSGVLAGDTASSCRTAARAS